MQEDNVTMAQGIIRGKETKKALYWKGRTIKEQDSMLLFSSL